MYLFIELRKKEKKTLDASFNGLGLKKKDHENQSSINEIWNTKFVFSVFKIEAQIYLEAMFYKHVNRVNVIRLYN